MCERFLCYLQRPETRKSPKQRDTIAENPKFVCESVKDRNMGLLLRSHAGSVTKSEFVFGSKKSFESSNSAFGRLPCGSNTGVLLAEKLKGFVNE